MRIVEKTNLVTKMGEEAKWVTYRKDTHSTGKMPQKPLNKMAEGERGACLMGQKPRLFFVGWWPCCLTSPARGELPKSFGQVSNRNFLGRRAVGIHDTESSFRLVDTYQVRNTKAT